jgi:hypothetical protein
MINDINRKILELEEIAHLKDSLSVKQQTDLVQIISKHSQGLTILFEFLINRQKHPPKSISYVDGIIFKCLYNCKIEALKIKLSQELQEGIVKLRSIHDIDYQPLYIALASNNFRKANELTQIYLKQLAKINKNNQRQWLYFTDIFNLPTQDLQTIDRLWTTYSTGKFGLSIQRKIWLYNKKDWEKFWHTIGWKVDKKNVRYPNGFTWDNTAPTGHLPLFNQIRGVQVLATLFMHPAWEIEDL